MTYILHSVEDFHVPSIYEGGTLIFTKGHKRKNYQKLLNIKESIEREILSHCSFEVGTLVLERILFYFFKNNMHEFWPAPVWPTVCSLNLICIEPCLHGKSCLDSWKRKFSNDYLHDKFDKYSPKSGYHENRIPLQISPLTFDP